MRLRYPVAALALSVGTLTAQPSTKLALEQYLEWETVSSPRLSPDGKQIIYGRRWADKMNDRWETTQWIMNVDGSRNRVLMNGGAVEWSPDGSRIAYTGPGQPSGSQIFV
ncbi:MAG: PD40 domain-containing protein, partial [Gemmatimonadetes bacterium]|nr:PD40 domain-containing protein [Gemmatimonadota bacterium]